MAEQLTTAAAKAGRLIPVKNIKRKTLRSGYETGAVMYYAVYVENADGSSERCLLFTASELTRAEARASKNPEDIPAKGFFADLLD